MREDIITLLKNKDTLSLDLKGIQKHLNIKDKNELNELIKTLEDMLNDGTLHYSQKKNKYLLFENSNLIKGELIINKYGDGYIKYNGQKIIIPKDKINGAMYKDTVIVDYDRNYLQGEIIKIIKHDNSNYVAEVISKNNKLYAKGLKRPPIEIVPTNISLVEGHRILVHNDNKKANVIEIIGHKDEPGVDIQSILYDYGFGRKWSYKAFEQLKEIPDKLDNEIIRKELSSGRIDLREKQIITMDCDDTKDIDDGYYIEKLENNHIRLNVVIADVDEFVPNDRPIDIEASMDTTSVYTPSSVDPMLDHKLSNGICSLNPNTDRLAMSYDLELDEQGDVVDFKPALAIINSKKKMRYSDVNKILEEDTMIQGYEVFYKSLLLSQKLYLQIQKQMAQNNFINFNSKEAKVILGEFGKPVEINIREQRTAENIIEYFMLLANSNITKFLEDNDLPCVYRVDGEPSQESLRKVFFLAKEKGIIQANELKNNYSAKDIQNLVERVGDTRIGVVINKMLIRSMDKARYSTINTGHYPLGLKVYGQHTSPIRRYPDLINQRILKYYLRYGEEATKKKFNKMDLETICMHCSERERSAKKCEQDAVEMKIIEFMSSYIGKTYKAIISSVDKDGINILLDNTLEAYIKKSSLPKDKYEFLENKYCLHGHIFDFSLGDEIEVRLKKANKDTRNIEVVIANCQDRKLDQSNKQSKQKNKSKKRKICYKY